MFGLFGPPSIERLKKKRAVAALEDIAERQGDAQRRAAAIAALGDLDEVAPLVRMLTKGPMKEEAAAALVRIKRPYKDSFAVWIHIVRNEWDRAVAIGHVAVDPLYECAMSNDERAIGAATALASMSAFYPQQKLLAVLRNGSDRVRKAVVEILLKSDDASNVLEVLASLRPDETATLVEAKDRLAEIRAKAAIDPLTKLLPDLLGELHLWRPAARKKLAYLGWQPRTNEQRAIWLGLDEPPQWDEIVKLGDHAAEPLITALAYKEELADDVLRTLARIGGRVVEKQLARLKLFDNALETLVSVNPSVAVRALLLQTRDKEGSREAVWKLTSLVKKHAASLSTDDLQILVNLGDTTRQRKASIWEMTSDPNGGLLPRDIVEDIDCSPIRVRAQEELDRRAS